MRGVLAVAEPAFTDPVVVKSLELYRLTWFLGHALALLSWDQEINMPSRAAEEGDRRLRAERALSQRLLSRELLSLLEVAVKRLEYLNDYEKDVVRVLRRSVDMLKKLPEEFVWRKAKVITEAQNVWREAKAKSDFSLFKPLLKEIVELSRQEAEYLYYEGHPYNALLDEFEEGLTIDDVDRMFNVVIP